MLRAFSVTALGYLSYVVCFKARSGLIGEAHSH
jgi:hypothetical protein